MYKMLLLITLIVFLLLPAPAPAEMDLFELDLSAEAEILWSPWDNSFKYGFGAPFAYAFDRIVIFKGEWVPGENFDTDKGEGQEALYGPGIGIDVIKLVNLLPKVELVIPEALQARIGATWLANLKGGIHFEPHPRITGAIIRYNFDFL